MTAPLIFAGALFAFDTWSTYRSGVVNPFETGIYLAGAKRVLEGQRVCGDFVSIYGSLQYFLHAAAMKLSRNDPIWSAAIPSIFGSQMLLLATWFVAARLTRNTVLILLAMWSSHTYAAGSLRMALALMSLWLAIIALTDRKRSLLYLSGFVASVGMIYWQDMGCYSFIAVSGAVMLVGLSEKGGLFERLRHALSLVWPLAAGFMAGNLIWITWHLCDGTFWPWIDQTFFLTLRRYDRLPMGTIPWPWSAPPLDAGVVSFWSRFHLDGPFRWFFYTVPFYFVPLVAFASLAASAIALFRGCPNRRWWIAVFAVACLGTIASRTILRVGDELKLKANSLPAALLAVTAAGSLTSSRSAVIRRSGRLAAMLAFVFVTYPFLQDSIKPSLHGQNLASIPRAVRADGNKDVYNAAEFVRTHAPGNTLFAAPTLPIMYVITGLENPTRLDYLDPIVLPDNEVELIAALDRSRPRFVVLDSGFNFWERYYFGKQFGRLTVDFIHQHYELVQTFGKILVYRSKDAVL